MVPADVQHILRVLVMAAIGASVGSAGSAILAAPPQIEKALQRTLDALSSRPHTVNAVALVHAPKADLLWCRAAGIANPEADQPMTTQHLFRVASVTKMLTAVVVLQLVEEGAFTLDTPLAELLPPSDLPDGQSVNDLLIWRGQPIGNAIRVNHLLSHRSGLPDYWSAEIRKGHYNGRSYMELLAEDGKNPGVNGLARKQWSPDEIIGFYCDSGFAVAALGRPGEVYHYADTNFVLLGVVVEKLTGMKLPNVYRQRVYKPLGMKDTYFEWYEECPRPRISHHFWFDEAAEGGGRNFDLIKMDYNSSADWAGGGLVATAADLDRFLRGLFGHRLFKSDETLQSMRATGETDVPELRYGLGLYRIKAKGGKVGWGHFGACGVSAFYFPGGDISIVLTRNQTLGTPYIRDVELFVSALESQGLF